jgi:hypothetical protein
MRIPDIREQWAKFQSRLFETAYQMATEGRHLIDNGKIDTASRLLTDYMAENVRVMLGMISEMLAI